MAEVKTLSVMAQHVADKDDFHRNGKGLVPGSFRISPPDADGEQSFWYCCPCGCGRIAPLTVGNGFKPSKASPDDATWKWNGSLEAPTLHPSVHHIGHWHGWLTDGVWRSC